MKKRQERCVIEKGETFNSLQSLDMKIVLDRRTIGCPHGPVPDTVGGINKSSETLAWADALTWSNNLADGKCSLADGSTAGQWRLPNVRELQSLVAYDQFNPALPSGYPFTDFKGGYWSSTSFAGNSSFYAWFVSFRGGAVDVGDKGPSHVTAVRGGP